jgi:aminoglycoside 6'-N-acetyltransferase I
MTDFTVTQMGAAEKAAWAEMRAALWPDETLHVHAAAIDELLQSGEAWGFVAETVDGASVDFVEIVIRKYANGCNTRPVAFLEGIWVRTRFRQQGVGARLLRRAEALLIASGFHELGSDTEIDNTQSQVVHLAWGFSETESVVYFRNDLRQNVR